MISQATILQGLGERIMVLAAFKCFRYPISDLFS